MWQIERLVPGGSGMAHAADGRVGFVPETVVGDRVEVTAVEDHGDWLRAKTWRLVTAGEARVESRCAWSSECGGCDWIALAREQQGEHKVAMVSEALRRTAGLSVADIPMDSAGEPWRYRQRIRVHVGRDGRCGLLASRSHDIVEVDDCRVAVAALSEALVRLRQELSRMRGDAGVAEVELRVAPGEHRVLCRITPRSVRRPPAPQLLRALSVAGLEVAIKATQPEPDQEWSQGSFGSLIVPAGSFVQVNDAVNVALIACLCSWARRHSVRKFVELYCGVGNLTFPLLRMGLEGRAFEIDESAIAAARRVARREGLDGASFAVSQAARLPPEPGLQAELVLVDPPRRGLREALAWIVALDARYVAICSCDPVTLARDLRELSEAGWELRDIRLFDMFPQTHHVETLVWLERRATEPCSAVGGAADAK